MPSMYVRIYSTYSAYSMYNAYIDENVVTNVMDSCVHTLVCIKEEESKGQYGSSPAIPHVCPPSIFNVTKTFSIICEFATEIEAALRLPHG